jgi:hypothetical protein
MDHYAFPSVDVFIEKHNRYSNWEAQVALDEYLRGSDSRLQQANVGWRRRLKRWSQNLPFRPLLRFLYVYVWQCGFLDGRPGFYFARLHGTYELLCLAKTVEATLKLRGCQSEIPPANRKGKHPGMGTGGKQIDSGKGDLLST